MKNYHKTVLKLLKKEITQNNVQLLAEDDEQIIRFLFHNYRKGKRKSAGLLLTSLGLSYLKEISQSWDFLLPEDMEFRTYHLLWFERNSSAPYYYDRTKRILTVFCPKISMRLKLLEANLDLLVEKECCLLDNR